MIHERVRGDKIKAAREKAGKTEQQVADEIGVSLEYYCFLENGALAMPERPVQTVSNKQMWDILNAVGGGDPSRITDNTSSHAEKYIYEGCISLMQELMDRVKEWLEDMGYEADYFGEEAFCTHFYPMEIVKRLFLWRTGHSGGTSCREKLRELEASDRGVEFSIKDDETADNSGEEEGEDE